MMMTVGTPILGPPLYWNISTPSFSTVKARCSIAFSGRRTCSSRPSQPMWSQIPGTVQSWEIGIWLVVGPPLWKIWVRQLGWWHSQYFWENKKWQPNHQPEINGSRTGFFSIADPTSKSWEFAWDSVGFFWFPDLNGESVEKDWTQYGIWWDSKWI